MKNTELETAKDNCLEFTDSRIKEKSCIPVDNLIEGNKYYITHITKKTQQQK